MKLPISVTVVTQASLFGKGRARDVDGRILETAATTLAVCQVVNDTALAAVDELSTEVQSKLYVGMEGLRVQLDPAEGQSVSEEMALYVLGRCVQAVVELGGEVVAEPSAFEPRLFKAA